VLAIVHDAAFVQRSATAALLGLISLAAFALAYATAAPRGWPTALLAAWLAFAAATGLFALLTAAVHVPPLVGFLAACASFVAAGKAMPAGDDGSITRAAPPPPPRWDLPVRALCAAAMVLAITGLSSVVGARVSGLLAPAPIITSILAAFTHAQAGIAPTLRLLRGMLTGFFAFAAFCLAVAALLSHAAVGVAFAAAAVTALAIAALTRAATTP
jgi:hypothetical protein